MNDFFKPNSRSTALLVTLLLLGCVVGGIGFVLGRDSAEPAQAQSVVRAAASKQVAAARKAGYERGFAAGRKAGERSAQDDRSQAADHGNASDRDALSAEGFDLDPGSYYIVQVAGGSGDARISDYAPMEPGISYELCDAYGVCRHAQ
jgi:hypothetical protein